MARTRISPENEMSDRDETYLIEIVINVFWITDNVTRVYQLIFVLEFNFGLT